MAFPPWTDEHTQLRYTVRQFAEKELAPHAEAWDKAGSFPKEIFKQLADMGLLGIRFDPAYGGLGLDYSYQMVVAEELGTIKCGGVPMGIGVQTDMCTPALARFGSDELREEFLRPAISGEYVGAIAVSAAFASSSSKMRCSRSRSAHCSKSP